MQDWRVRKGRLECFVAGGDRHVYLLTREISMDAGDFALEVRLGRLEGEQEPLGPGFAGFRVGINGRFDDWRNSAIYGEGVNAGVTSDGFLFIGAARASSPRISTDWKDLRFRLEAKKIGQTYALVLTVFNVGAGQAVRLERTDIPEHWLIGGIALVCSSGKIRPTPAPLPPLGPSGGTRAGTERSGNLRFWFRDWSVSGSKIAVHEERAFGPVYFAMHTLSRGVLKLTAQLAPLDVASTRIQLETKSADNAWRLAGTSAIDALSRTATFRIAGWDDSRDTKYRIRCFWRGSGEQREQTFTGTIRHDPTDKTEMVLGVLTCNNDLAFPNQDLVRNLRHFQPDILIFTGDQIYEPVGGYGNQREPLEAAALDYLRKWVLFGWAYGDLLRDIPTITIPDDHDVFHGNIWGAGGKKAEPPAEIYPINPGQPVIPADRIRTAQDAGGYTMFPEWVNMVQRTQTSHLPDPFDPTPVAQGIGVYYTALVYGGVSFAILEDRKWKSAPRAMIPWADIRDGVAQNPDYNAARDGDVVGAELLGPRQIDFLNHWAADWAGVWMKAVVSQTLLADLVTLPSPGREDHGPSLPIYPVGGYAPDDVCARDHDSNGWPQAGRNTALRAFRRGVAIHLGGDQHLGSTVQYGIDEWNDGPYALCTPAIASTWPRRWFPPDEGRNRQPGAARNTGEYMDGFGNRITVHAVANPARFGAEPRALHERSPGYGIVRLNRTSRTVSFANWPRYTQAWQTGAKPYPGWPIVFHQLDNGLSRARYVLPSLTVPDEAQPVVQVLEDATGEVMYTVRWPGHSFRLPVFREGVFSVRLLDERGNVRRQWTGLRATSAHPV
jgi:hypothetical protein